MVSLLLLSYFEKQAKKSGELQKLLAESTEVLLREEELCNLDKAYEEETTILTMDVYDAECNRNQLKQKYEQQRLAQEHIYTFYKHSMEACYQLQNYDWNSKLQLMKLQYQNDMRELSEEYEMEEQRKMKLEQRLIVQAARAAEGAVLDLQAKINQLEQTEAERKAKFMNQIQELRSELNDYIVYFVKGSKEIVDGEKELETLKRSHDKQVEEILNQKQELQEHNAELPAHTNGNAEEEVETLPKLEISPTLEPFPEMGNVCNATTVCGDQKKPSFLQLFKEWESEQQLHFQEFITTTANAIADSPPITKTMVMETLNDSSHIDESLTNGYLNNPPRSILRRPYATDEDESETVGNPKKRVRFAEPEVHESEFAFLPEAALNKIEYANTDKEKQSNNVANFTFFEENAPCSFNGATETIEIFSTAEGDGNEIRSADKFEKQKVKTPFLVKANKLVKKAKLMGSRKLVNQVSKPRKSASDKGKPKIEIQECRIVKPAGTKLPTKLPVELSPEPTARVSAKIENNHTVMLPETSDSNVFKSPPKPQKRKAATMPDCDTFFREFLEQGSDSLEATKGTCDPSRTCNETESKPKRKKTEMDFDRFFRKTLMGTNESGNGSAKLTAPTVTKESDDDFLQFDMKYDESTYFLGDSVDDFYTGQKNSERDDDSLSFEFDGDEKRKNDDFL